MEIFLYTGLFEFGVQPDIGVIGPYPFEDEETRIAHPEWCPVDRWGERRCPGPISFCYPEARKLVIDRYVKNLVDYGYDGINFYTYVENCGIRYEDEFGFNQPIVDLFNKKYPDVNLRKDNLTQEQKELWYACRGSFVTTFLRELHIELSKHGKKLSMIVDARNPDYAQPWWGKKIAGTGKIKMDWRQWVRERFVDEIWVQLAETKAQHETLDLIIKDCLAHGVKMTVRAVSPYNTGWSKYIKTGVTPIAVITWKNNGIEKYSFKEIDKDSLKSADWKVRLQALNEVQSGTLKVLPKQIASLSNDSHVLVRKSVMTTLAKMKASSEISTIEAKLSDKESSVRMAAADALAIVYNQNSPARIISALENDEYFQMKSACVNALSSMKNDSLPYVIEGMKHSKYSIREVCIQALCLLGKEQSTNKIIPILIESVENVNEDQRIRCHAIDGLINLRNKYSNNMRVIIAKLLIKLVKQDSSVLVQLRAAWGLGYFYEIKPKILHEQILECLTGGFKNYGDDCKRADSSYGWRLFGNALLMHHGTGRQRLEEMRKQNHDKWLSWLAYEVIYLPHRSMQIKTIDEKLAIEQHRKYAPPFPGYRT